MDPAVAMSAIHHSVAEFESERLPPFVGVTVNEWEFVWERMLGEGCYGEVWLATFLHNNEQYAVKKIFKEVILKAGFTKTLVMERKALCLMGDVETVVKLYATFQDDQHVFFVLEFVEGGELGQLQSRLGGTIPLPLARHYAAELIITLKNLKAKKCVHRDIKPENILLTADGHIRLTDFGTAKILGDRNQDGIRALKTRTFSKNTFCGTAHYISPEILFDRPCSYLSDIWAFAVILYNFLTGNYPFNSPSPYLLFQKIKRRLIDWPEDMDPDGRDLIDRILQVVPKQRLGHGRNGFKMIKAHPFFEGVDFGQVLVSSPPGFIPKEL